MLMLLMIDMLIESIRLINQIDAQMRFNQVFFVGA